MAPTKHSLTLACLDKQIETGHCNYKRLTVAG